MASYTRQSTFSNDDIIEASHHNAEYDKLVAVFNNSTGHSHDGTAAEGPVIEVIGDAGIAIPLNKVVVDTLNKRISVFVDVSSSAVEQLRVEDGVIYPVTDNDVDLGKSAKSFKNLYVSGTITAGGGNVLLTTNNLSDLDNAATARTNLGAENVTLAGTPTYITITDQVITRGLITLTSDVTGSLPVANGGTGSATAAGARTNLSVPTFTVSSSTPSGGSNGDWWAVV